MNLAHLAPWALLIGGAVLAVKVGGDVWQQVHSTLGSPTAAAAGSTTTSPTTAGVLCPHFCTQATCGCGAAA